MLGFINISESFISPSNILLTVKAKVLPHFIPKSFFISSSLIKSTISHIPLFNFHSCFLYINLKKSPCLFHSSIANISLPIKLLLLLLIGFIITGNRLLINLFNFLFFIFVFCIIGCEQHILQFILGILLYFLPPPKLLI